MNHKMMMNVVGIKRGEVDGNRYAALYMLSDSPEYSRDAVGLGVMKIACDFDLIDRLNPQDVPGIFNADVSLVMAAGGKAGIRVHGLQPVKKG